MGAGEIFRSESNLVKAQTIEQKNVKWENFNPKNRRKKQNVERVKTNCSEVQMEQNEGSFVRNGAKA